MFENNSLIFILRELIQHTTTCSFGSWGQNEKARYKDEQLMILISRCYKIPTMRFWPISTGSINYSSVQFSHSVVSDSLWPHESQHSRPPCPSPTPGVHSNHVHRVGDAIQPSHPRSSPFPPDPNPSQHQSFFQWVNSSHKVAKLDLEKYKSDQGTI